MDANSKNLSTRRPGRPSGQESGAGRAALLQAVRELLAERGLSGVTSKQVAERAGVRPTLVNYYFGDRQGLLRAVIGETSSEINQKMRSATEQQGPPEDRLRRLLSEVLHRFAEEPYAARLFFEQVMFAADDVIDDFSEQFGRETFGLFRKILDQGIAAGRFRPVDLEIAIATIGGLCIFFGAATPLLERVMEFTGLTEENAESIADRAATLLLDGLLVPSP